MPSFFREVEKSFEPLVSESLLCGEIFGFKAPYFGFRHLQLNLEDQENQSNHGIKKIQNYRILRFEVLR